MRCTHSWKRVAVAVLLLSLPLLSHPVWAASGTRPARTMPYWEQLLPSRPGPLFHQGAGIALDRSGEVYIADPFEQRVKKFSARGTLLATWGTDAPGPLHWTPTAVAVDARGDVYVLAGGVFKLSPQGRLLSHWSAPAGTALVVGGSGNIFVLSSRDVSGGARGVGAHEAQIDKFASNGKLLSTWTSPPLHAIEAIPNGLAIDPRGEVYVSVATANCDRPCPLLTTAIYRFSTGGRASPIPHAPGITWGPVMAADAGRNLFLSMVANDVGRVEKVAATGKLLTVWGMPSAGRQSLGDVLHVALGSQGRLYLADSHVDGLPEYAASGVIHILSARGVQLSQWGAVSGSDAFQLGASLAVNRAGAVFYTGGVNHAAYTVLSPDGRHQHTFGTAGRPHDQLFSPEAIALDGQGNVYLTDDIGGRIAKYSASGRLLNEWTLLGPDDGLLAGLALDPGGNIYTLAEGQGRIIKLSPQGKILAHYAGRGARPGQLMGPMSLAIETNGDIVVADTYNNRIQRFSAGGHPLGGWPIGEQLSSLPSRPESVTVDSEGKVYVAEMQGRIEEFSATGTRVAGWGNLGIEVGQLFQPTDVALGPHGNLYVADEASNRLQKLVRHQ